MPNLYATNKTSSNITVTSCTVHYIDSTNAELVTVYDGNDVPCDAFQYSLSGVPWWYVLDGVHDSWVDDLSSIEYHLPTVLPTVSVNILFANSDKSTAQKISSTIGTFWYDDNSANVLYQSGWAYLMIKYYTGTGDTAGQTYRIEYCYFEDRYGRLFLGAHMPDYGSIYVQRAEIATCSDSTATVVTVYDSSNNAYNAFKYTANGSDYYYVLDGTQTDWTDDLAGIGYSLTPTTQRAWLTTSGPHSDKYLNTGTEYSVVDSYDSHIPYDSTKTYILVGVYKINGTQVQGSFSLVSGGDGYGNTILKIVNNSTRTEVGYLDYYTT